MRTDIVLFVRTRPRISSQTVDLERLRRLPDETLGRWYISFLDKNVSCNLLPRHFRIRISP